VDLSSSRTVSHYQRVDLLAVEQDFIIYKRGL
jgi:hypothetical protein